MNDLASTENAIDKQSVNKKDEELERMIEKFNNTKAENIKLTEREHMLLFNYLKELKLYRKLHPKL